MLKTVDGIYNYDSGTLEFIDVPEYILKNFHGSKKVRIIFLEDEQDSSSEDMSSDTTILPQLYGLLGQLYVDYGSLTKRSSLLEKFSHQVNQHLWEAYREHSYNHSRVVTLLKTALRRLSAATLQLSQIDALQSVLETLEQSTLTREDILINLEHLRKAGIDMLPTLPVPSHELMPLYDDDTL